MLNFQTTAGIISAGLSLFIIFFICKTLGNPDNRTDINMVIATVVVLTVEQFGNFFVALTFFLYYLNGQFNLTVTFLALVSSITCGVFCTKKEQNN